MTSQHGAADCPLVAIVPSLNEAARIESLIIALREAQAPCVVCDGGSSDRTAACARQAGAIVVSSAPGRALQLNVGARRAMAEFRAARWLLFLHADTQLPAFDTPGCPLTGASDVARWVERLEAGGRAWARFDVRLQPANASPYNRWLLALVAASMNIRSALTGICTGDQGLFVRRDLFEAIGGFPQIALMEDIEISAALKRQAGYPLRIRSPLTVSARRWERDGVLRTMISMWWTRLRYFAGTPADTLHAAYYRKRATTRQR